MTPRVLIGHAEGGKRGVGEERGRAWLRNDIRSSDWPCSHIYYACSDWPQPPKAWQCPLYEAFFNFFSWSKVGLYHKFTLRYLYLYTQQD